MTINSDVTDANSRKENMPAIRMVVPQSQLQVNMPVLTTSMQSLPRIPVFRPQFPSMLPISHMACSSQGMTSGFSPYTVYQTQTVINAEGQPTVIYNPVVMAQPMMNMNPNFTEGPGPQNISALVNVLPSDDKAKIGVQVEGRKRQRLQIIDPRTGKKVKLPGDISDNEEERNSSKSEISNSIFEITNTVITSHVLPKKKTLLDIIDPKTGQKVDLNPKNNLVVESLPKASTAKIEIVNPETGAIIDLQSKKSTIPSVSEDSAKEIPFKEIELLTESEQSNEAAENNETDKSATFKSETIVDETVSHEAEIILLASGDKIQSSEEINNVPVSEEKHLPSEEVNSVSVSEEKDIPSEEVNSVSVSEEKHFSIEEAVSENVPEVIQTIELEIDEVQEVVETQVDKEQSYEDLSEAQTIELEIDEVPEVVETQVDKKQSCEDLSEAQDNDCEVDDAEIRKYYERDFMLHIRSNMTFTKPLLPKLEIVLSEFNKNTYSKETSFISKQQQDFGNHSRNNFQERYHKMFARRPQENIVLHKSDSAWNPSKKPQTDDEMLFSKLKSILNKLTPQYFDQLVDQVKELSIDSEERLSGCINLLFDQSVVQPVFSSLYAEMAKMYATLAVPSKSDKTKTVKFRTLLLQKCQTEFEQEKVIVEIVSDFDIKISNAKSETEKKQLVETKEESVVKAKRRYLGTIRFIGELYKIDMLTESIMHECLSKLLKDYKDEDKIECLCKLLSTIGKKIDNPKSKIKVDGYFSEMRVLIKEKNPSTRIKFMIMNLADQRKNNWELRRKDDGPKKIDDIHKESGFTKPVPSSNFDTRNVSRKETQPAKHLRNSTSQNENKPVKKNDLNDWTTINTSIKVEKPTTELPKFVFSKVNDNTKLGPSKSNWGKGSAFGNRFAPISGMTELEKPVVVVKDTPKQEPLVEPTTVEVVKNNKQLELSRDDMEIKVKSRVEEYLMIKDVKEAIDSVKELNTETCFKNAVSFFYISLEQNIEKTSKVREQVGSLHLNVLKSGIASIEAYAEALRKLSRFADDLIVDIPQIWKYLGECVSTVFLDGSDLNLDILIPSENVDDSDDEFEQADDDNTARLLAVILREVGEKKGSEFATQLWEKSGLQWENLVKSRSVQEFAEKFLK